MELLFFVIPLGVAQPRNPQTLTLSLPESNPSRRFCSNPSGTKKSNSFGIAFFVIPLGVAQPRNPQTLTLNLPESNPSRRFCSNPSGTKKATLLELLFCDPAGSGSAPRSPNTNPEPSRIEPIPTLLFESSGHKKKPQSVIEAFFVIPLGFEPRTHTLKVYCSTS